MTEEIFADSKLDTNVQTWVDWRNKIQEYRHNLGQEGDMGPKPPAPAELGFFERAEEEAKQKIKIIKESLDSPAQKQNEISNLVSGELAKSDGPEKVYILSEVVKQISERTSESYSDKYRILGQVVERFPQVLDLPSEDSSKSTLETLEWSLETDLDLSRIKPSEDIVRVIERVSEREKNLEKKSEWEFKAFEVKGFLGHEKMLTEIGSEGTSLNKINEIFGLDISPSTFEDLKKGDGYSSEIRLAGPMDYLSVLARYSRQEGVGREKILGLVVGALKKEKANILSMITNQSQRDSEVNMSNVKSKRLAGLRVIMEAVNLDNNKISFREMMDSQNQKDLTDNGLSKFAARELYLTYFNKDQSDNTGFHESFSRDMNEIVDRQHRQSESGRQQETNRKNNEQENIQRSLDLKAASEKKAREEREKIVVGDYDSHANQLLPKFDELFKFSLVGWPNSLDVQSGVVGMELNRLKGQGINDETVDFAFEVNREVVRILKGGSVSGMRQSVKKANILVKALFGGVDKITRYFDIRPNKVESELFELSRQVDWNIENEAKKRALQIIKSKSGTKVE